METLPARERIRLILEANPEQTLEAVGKQVGVSRERVRQLVNKLGLERRTPTIDYGSCKVCSKPFYQRNKTGYCREHKPRVPRVNLSCSWCGKQIIRPWYDYRPSTGRGLAFCDKQCQGFWVGNNYGVKRKTHCKYGHPLTEATTYNYAYGRYCKKCRKERRRKYYKRNRK